MEQLQYHPNANARALAQQSTETLGLIVGDVWMILKLLHCLADGLARAVAGLGRIIDYTGDCGDETLGLIVGDVSDPFFGAMVKAVDEVAGKTGNFFFINSSSSASGIFLACTTSAAQRWRISCSIACRSFSLGLIVGDVSDPFFGAMVKAVDEVAGKTGNFLLIAPYLAPVSLTVPVLHPGFSWRAPPALRNGGASVFWRDGQSGR
jgi:DNA-binding LacI/PurR family transcriptional regulator